MLRRLLDDGGRDVAAKVAVIYVLLIGANIAAWAWAWASFAHYPLLLGTALLAYSFGLRHAVDADHIAAIDNVTRALMAQGRRPVSVGLFFSLGHSTIVVLASVAIAATATAFKSRFAQLEAVGSVLGTLVSAAFLFAIAGVNIMVLRSTWRSFRRHRAGVRLGADEIGASNSGGPLSRLFRPVFARMGRAWHMYPLGVLFGLGFDTATEVGLLGISAAQATDGLPIWSILVFPALFTAGMSLIDTTDGILMLGAYGWAFLKPVRKIYYNLTITAVSVGVALLVGGIEVAGLLGGRLALKGAFWSAMGSLNAHFGTIGFAILGVFALSWIVSVLIHRRRGYGDLGVDVDA